MPLVELTLVAGRSAQQIEGVIARLHRVVVEELGAPEETVRVIVREVPPTHWSSGGRTIAQKRASEPQRSAAEDHEDRHA